MLCTSGEVSSFDQQQIREIKLNKIILYINSLIPRSGSSVSGDMASK
jgi:hypothetical protein